MQDHTASPARSAATSRGSSGSSAAGTIGQAASRCRSLAISIPVISRLWQTSSRGSP
ncbi:hypothetical protein ACFQ0M_05485 [Kitasatospora aburaviensis]